MILEAQQILDAMIEAGFDLNETHPELKHPGKAAAIHAYISEDGTKLEKLGLVSAEQSQQFWTQGNGNKNKFPVDKIDGPEGFARTQEELKAWNKLRGQDKTDRLKKWISDGFPVEFPDPFSKNQIKEFESRRTCLASLDTTSASRLLDLFDVVTESKPEHRKAWVQAIFEYIRNLAVEGAADEINEGQKMLATLLFKPKSKPRVDKVPVIWDLAGVGLSGTSASSPENFVHVNMALLATLKPQSQKENGNDDQRAICALTGTPDDIEGGKFPNPKLPPGSYTYLFSRNGDNASFARYGLNSVDTFPVNRGHLRQLEAALTKITAANREGKTWTPVASEQPRKSDLLLIFCPTETDLPFADGIGAEQVEINQFQFEELAQRLAALTKGDTTDQLRGTLMVAVIRSVDKGNRKVIFRRNLDVAGLDRAAQRWSAACRGLPGRRFFVPIGKGKDALLLGPGTLNPGEIPRLTKQVYLTDGTAPHGDSAGGLTFSESFELLLAIENCDHPLASRALRVAQQRLGNVLFHFATLQYRTPNESTKQKPELRWTCLKTQSLFALLLSAHHREPQQTMKSLAYQLGQFSAALDVIHAAYCYAERGGDLPPKLIGNACYQAATRSPVGALAQASQRIAPHLGWLRQFRGDKADKALAKMPERSDARSTTLYALKLRGAIGEMARTMTDLRTPQPTDSDLFRAELLLGYLAGPPDRTVEDTSETKQETQSNRIS